MEWIQNEGQSLILACFLYSEKKAEHFILERWLKQCVCTQGLNQYVYDEACNEEIEAESLGASC